MSLVPGTTDKYEVSLNVQEVEDISDYLDDDGYLHHELLEHHAATTTAPTTTTPSAPSTPGSTPPATLSKRQRIRRFFGRARSSSTTSNPATTNNNTTHAKDDLLHQDLPYHHQSKDGIILPLSREYRYQYKFVIDDEWKCDPNRPQVQDSEGHWNHELTVELIEQIHQRPTASMLEAVTNRSRSSSLQNQLMAPPVTKEEGKQGEAAAKQDQTEIRQDHVEVLTQPMEHETDVAETETETREIHSPPPPPYSAPLNPLTAAAVDKVIVSKPKVRAARPPRDTFEAVLIFDEKDDLSDGEGGRVPRAEVDDESDYDDDEDEEDEEAEVQQQPSQEEVPQQQIATDGEAAGVVTPQQDDDHSKEQPQHADNDQGKQSISYCFVFCAPVWVGLRVTCACMTCLVYYGLWICERSKGVSE